LPFTKQPLGLKILARATSMSGRTVHVYSIVFSQQWFLLGRGKNAFSITVGISEEVKEEGF
jgi:hypothetical protein